MACSRGAASPDSHTKTKLYASSGGYCQNPGCASKLFLDEAGKSIHIAELAHVFAASDDGPRANVGMIVTDRGAFDNLIVLCANCHTRVDKAPDSYPDSLMFKWKREHAVKLEGLFGAVKFADRPIARTEVEAILDENYAIFKQYGPHIDAAANPESGAAEQWKRKMLTRILPNSNRLIAIVQANQHLLQPDEKVTFHQFRQHIDDLTAFHVEDSREDASRFPDDFANILQD